MPRNYNTTLNKPFIRGQEIIIKYGISESERIKLSVTEVEAIVDADNKTNIISGFSNSFEHNIPLAELGTESFDLVNPITGDNLGQTMSMQTLFVGIVSYVRKIQKIKYPD